MRTGSNLLEPIPRNGLLRSTSLDGSAVRGFKPKTCLALIAGAALGYMLNDLVTGVIHHGEDFCRSGLRAGVVHLRVFGFSKPRAESDVRSVG